jgi:riboflavin synthase
MRWGQIFFRGCVFRFWEEKNESMFTGIVENMGIVASFTEEEEAWRLVLELPFVDGGGLKPGDSLAIDGCCLTVTELSGLNASFDLLEETLLRTTFGSLVAGDKVNLERSLAADGRLGGHFVTGHIDATGEVTVFEERGKNIYLQVRVPEEFSHFLADKGSVAVDGCSLTVCDVQQDLFAVWLIPHTLSLTSLESLKVGDLVNLEFDLLAKYVERISSRGQ